MEFVPEIFLIELKDQLLQALIRQKVVGESAVFLFNSINPPPAQPFGMPLAGNTAERLTAPVIRIVYITTLMVEGFLKGCFEIGYFFIPVFSLIRS